VIRTWLKRLIVWALADGVVIDHSKDAAALDVLAKSLKT
jgi:aspartate carbamoyltransferase regulatory subunit